jgi:hypothetical protein
MSINQRFISSAKVAGMIRASAPILGSGVGR